MISRKLFGPPGTGKTTRLLRYVKTFLKLGTPIDKIGYFAFTTKAANEAVDRMLDYHTAFQKKDLKHFRTLHSLAFNQLGMKKAQVMQDEHYEDIGRILGIEVTVYSGGEETTGFINSDSEYFNLINAARIKNMSIEEEYNTDMYSQEMNKQLLQIISDELQNYKDSYKLVDFTDMIERFNVSELCPKFDVAFIDEAQDLSPIQWKMVEIIKKNSKYVILAGDDDQAIYGWAGADVKKFQQESLDILNISKEKRISSKFFRHITCPELIVTDHPYVITNNASNDIQNIPLWIFEWLKKKYISNEINSKSSLPKKIYIDRTDSSSNTKALRLIINENEVKQFLTKTKLFLF